VGSLTLLLWHSDLTKFSFSWASAPDPVGGAYSSPHIPSQLGGVILLFPPSSKLTDDWGASGFIAMRIYCHADLPPSRFISMRIYCQWR